MNTKTNHSQTQQSKSANFLPKTLLVLMVAAIFTIMPSLSQAQLFVSEHVVLGTTNKGLPGGEFAFAHDEGQDFPMVAIAGHNVSRGFVRIYSQEYLNFSVIQDLRLNLRQAKLAWGDVDNDGDSDLLVTGKLHEKNTPIAAIYINVDGKEFYRAQRLKGVAGGSASFGDIDNDGDLDILMTGKGIKGDACHLYRNYGDGYFAEISTGLTGISHGGAYFADLDGDDDLDILLAGSSSKQKEPVFQIYRNEDGGFMPTEMDMGGLKHITADFADYDHDGDLDILMTGKNEHSHPTTVLLENDGDMSFQKVETGMVNVAHGNASFGDVDHDGDADIFLTGKNAHGKHIVQFYRNDAGNWTSIEMEENLSAHFAANSSLFDYNADGDLDAVYVKASPDYPRITTLANNISFTSETMGMK